MLSSLLFVTGIVLRMANGASDTPAVPLFDILRAPDPGLMVSALGVLLLAATPALRVVALIVIWAREHDWRFVLVAAVVGSTLTASVLLGRG